MYCLLHAACKWHFYRCASLFLTFSRSQGARVFNSLPSFKFRFITIIDILKFPRKFPVFLCRWRHLQKTGKACKTCSKQTPHALVHNPYGSLVTNNSCSKYRLFFSIFLPYYIPSSQQAKNSQRFRPPSFNAPKMFFFVLFFDALEQS